MIKTYHTFYTCTVQRSNSNKFSLILIFSKVKQIASIHVFKNNVLSINI